MMNTFPAPNPEDVVIFHNEGATWPWIVPAVDDAFLHLDHALWVEFDRRTR